MKRSFVAVGIVAAAFLFGADADAQTGTARGKVLDDKGQPVEAAKVELSFTGGVTRKYETKTNKKGEYTQVGVYPGNYQIVITKEGFPPTGIEARIKLGEPTYLPDIKLQAGKMATGGLSAEEIQAQFQKAYDATQAGDLDAAEATYKDLLAKAPMLYQVHHNLGIVYTQKKDWASAEASFKKALEIKPDFSDSSVELSKVYQASGQQDKAMAMMTGAGAESDPKILFSLGITHLNSGKYAEAAEAFKKVEALDPNNAEVHYHLGTIALNQGKSDECVQLLEKYLSFSPKNAQNVQTAQGLIAALKKK